MNVFFDNVDAFCRTPIMQFISCIILIVFGVHLMFKVYKTLKQPDVNLYEKENLNCIAFSLSCAIDGYKDHFDNEELLCNEHYVKLCVLHREVCKMIGEDPGGRKLTCSKSLLP